MRSSRAMVAGMAGTLLVIVFSTEAQSWVPSCGNSCVESWRTTMRIRPIQIQSNPASIRINTMMGCDWSVDYFMNNVPRDSHVAVGQVSAASAHDLESEQSLNGLLNQAAAKALVQCPNNKIVSVQVSVGSSPAINAWMDKTERHWYFANNHISDLIRQEDVARAAAQARQRDQEIAQQKAKQEAEDREKRKQAAIADCAGGPKISGGPWLSSTYSVGANDEARRTGYSCVKAIEYIGPAVNPMGGNAARARFTGYDQNFNSIAQVRDFAY